MTIHRKVFANASILALNEYNIKMYIAVTLKVQSMGKDNMWQPYAVSGDEMRTSSCYTYINSNHIL